MKTPTTTTIMKIKQKGIYLVARAVLGVLIRYKVLAHDWDPPDVFVHRGDAPCCCCCCSRECFVLLLTFLMGAFDRVDRRRDDFAMSTDWYHTIVTTCSNCELRKIVDNEQETATHFNDLILPASKETEVFTKAHIML